ncbi:DUF6528 family protein [Ulvibacterium sp.]|uniref:DUF6528 family protein n=1 Tax=Ulvibacterium sp. TaxID=2665914 RepID=UPI002604C350|nr:DUF6528 family protein [Ulvibacterium sp.]
MCYTSSLISLRSLALLGIILLIMGCAHKKERQANAKMSSIREIIVGGDDKIRIFDFDSLQNGRQVVNWELRTGEIIGLPDSVYSQLMPIDDHKSVNDHTQLLISSSGSGVVLLDRETKRALFHTTAPNAHSVELLPNNRVAVALSTAKGGNSVEIYDISRSGIPIFWDSLYSGHGLVWNPKRERLYALGYDEIRAYSLQDWTSDLPKLRMERCWKLPETGGHDLFAPNWDQLLVSSSKKVWKFTISPGSFSPFDPIANEEKVKSVYYDDVTGELLYTKGEINWWTHRVYFKNPDKKIEVPDIKMYKARVIKRDR